MSEQVLSYLCPKALAKTDSVFVRAISSPITGKTGLALLLAGQHGTHGSASALVVSSSPLAAVSATKTKVAQEAFTHLAHGAYPYSHPFACLLWTSKAPAALGWG